MEKVNRRQFIRSAALASALPVIAPARQGFVSNIEKAKKPDILLGVMTAANNPEEDLKLVRDLGFATCQLYIDQYSSELARRLSRTMRNYNLIPDTLICMGPGDYKWNLIEGPETIGLVPRAMRSERVERLKQGIDFSKEAGIPVVHAHFGFIPENPKDALYLEFIDTMKPIGEYALKRGINLYFETGQETPVTLLRALRDIGTGNLFVNYDVANLVMYGKANPTDGLKVIGPYVRSLHAKDGLYPTSPDQLGKEVLIPEGEVDFPAIIAALRKLNFKGNIIIECELSGHKQDYILKTKRYLEGLLAQH